jgi:hypothetical protein
MTTGQDGGKVVSFTHRSPLPQEIYLVLISVRGQGHSANGSEYMAQVQIMNKELNYIKLFNLNRITNYEYKDNLALKVRVSKNYEFC